MLYSFYETVFTLQSMNKVMYKVNSLLCTYLLKPYIHRYVLKKAFLLPRQYVYIISQGGYVERERASYFLFQTSKKHPPMQYIYYVVQCTMYASRKGIEADAKNVGRKTVRKKSTVQQYTRQYVKKLVKSIEAKRCRGVIAKVGLTD